MNELDKLYKAATERPEYRAIVGYLTARGIDPRNSQTAKAGPIQAANKPLKSVEELLYDLSQRANQQMQLQKVEMPGGNLNKSISKMSALKAPNTESGMTDLRILLDIATREQLANPYPTKTTPPRPAVKPGML